MPRRKFQVFRENKVHVRKRMCATCIYRPDSEIFNTPIKAQAVKRDTAVICHEHMTGNTAAICRWFYDHDKTPTLHIADILNYVEFDS